MYDEAVVAVSEGNDLSSVVAIRNSLSTSSIVAFKGSSFLVGNDVDTDPEVNVPSHTVRMVKRLMGLPLPQVDRTNRNYLMLSYKVVQDKKSAVRNNAPSTVPPVKMCAVSLQYKNKECVYRSEIISGLLLAMIREELELMYNLQGQRPGVVISVPVYFSTVQRRATEAAGLTASFDFCVL